MHVAQRIYVADISSVHNLRAKLTSKQVRTSRNSTIYHHYCHVHWILILTKLRQTYVARDSIRMRSQLLPNIHEEIYVLYQKQTDDKKILERNVDSLCHAIRSSQTVGSISETIYLALRQCFKSKTDLSSCADHSPATALNMVPPVASW